MKVRESIISVIHDAKVGSRIVAGITLFFFSWMNVAPAVAAAREEINKPSSSTSVKCCGAEAVTTALEDVLNKRLQAIVKKSASAKAKKQKANYTAERQAIRDLQAQLKEEDQKTLQRFREDMGHIEESKLPDIVRLRHDESQARFEKEASIVQAELASIQGADDNSLSTRAQHLLEHLQSLEPKRAKVLDLKNLPFKAVSSKVRKPGSSGKELRDVLNPHLKVAGESLSPAQRKQEISHAELAAIERAAREGEFIASSPESAQVASIGLLTGILGASAYSPPTPDNLAPTEDAQITPAIQALAAQLNNDPVQINNWVHDNIEWLPSYGSIQGSQLTLDKREGNAFDTASLLISLLRAAAIPARYVYGTINIPIAQAMNWVGGVTDPNATLEILGQGGIPNMGLAQSGKVVAVQMEHVWVEAFVNFAPGRGARSVGASSWVPLDPAFKQYSYKPGYALQSVPFDVQDFLDAALQGTSTGADGNSVQNLNEGNVQAKAGQYTAQLLAFVNQQNPNATSDDIAGSKTIIKSTASVLPSGLPYHVTAIGAAVSSLPDSLRHRFQYALFADSNALEQGDAIFSYQDDTVNLAGKKVTLVFEPATDSDRQTINSYLPMPNADGSPLEPTQFPQSLPAYQIHVVPQLRVDNAIVAQGGEFALGTPLIGQGGFTNLNLQGMDLTTDVQTAGQASALGLSLQGGGQQQLAGIQARLAMDQDLIASGQGTSINASELNGDVLAAVMQSYFISIEDYAHTLGKLRQVVSYPGLSYGFFHADAIPIYSYGVITKAKYSGLNMDVSHIRILDWAQNNDTQTAVKFNSTFGYYFSAMEEFVPEKAFSQGTNGLLGISAVTALQQASQDGQTIYRIDSSNASTVIPTLGVSDQVKSDAQAAVDAGKVVIISQGNTTVGAWTGVGYIVSDPQTGSGAYLIAGGLNGSDTNLCNNLFLAIEIFLITTLIIAAIAAIALGGPLVGPALVEVGAYVVDAIAALARPAIQAAVAASLGLFVSAGASAGVAGEICRLLGRADYSVGGVTVDHCAYWCLSDNTTFNKPPSRDWCGNKFCPKAAIRP